MDWYKRYMGDYLKDTADLNMTEDGAYTLLLDHYYVTERPLPSDVKSIYRIVRAFERWERDAVDSVLAQFFILTERGYENKRAEEELAKYKKAADAYRTNGRVRSSDPCEVEGKTGKRFAIMRRDNFTCQYCGARAPNVTLQVDHRIALVNGGTEDESNLVTSCSECNGGKGPSDVSNLPPKCPEKPDTRNQIKTKSRGAPAALPAPPDWIPPELWDGFVKLRQELHKRITPQQMERLIGKLAKVRDSGGSIEAVLDYSVSNGYCGLFPERGFANSRGSSPQVKRETMAGSGLEIPEGVSVRTEYLERVRQRQEETAKNLFPLAARKGF